VALVLGAGGPVGHAFHAGVLAALAGEGWDARRADLIVGTSVGAVTAGLLRAGMDPLDIFHRVTGTPLSDEGERLVTRGGGWPAFVADLGCERRRSGRPASLALLRRLVSNPRLLRPGLLVAAITPAGTVDPAPIADGFRRILGSGWASRPMWLCAVDLDTGARQVFGSPGAPHTEVGRAVAASCAVPSFFEPVRIEGRRYIDGGVHSPANTDVLTASCGVDIVVVSVPMGISGFPRRAGLDLPGRWLNHRNAWGGLAAVQAAGARVAVFEPARPELELMHYNAFDLSRRAEIARRARLSTARRLRAGREGSLMSGLRAAAAPDQGSLGTA
jgi:NTE family protein